MNHPNKIMKQVYNTADFINNTLFTEETAELLFKIIILVIIPCLILFLLWFIFKVSIILGLIMSVIFGLGGLYVVVNLFVSWYQDKYSDHSSTGGLGG